MKRQTRLTVQRCDVIDPLSLTDYEAHGGLAGLRRAFGMSVADVVGDVTPSGLRRRGDAVLPTGIKCNTVLGALGPQKYIVCNADEGDSGTFTDRMIMGGDPFTLIEGMVIAGLVVFDISADMPGMARFAMEVCAVESYGTCTPCRIGAVRGMEPIDRIAQGDGAAVALLEDLCETMKDGSQCALGGFTPYPVLSTLYKFLVDFGQAKKVAD